jgi:glycine/D-amino acid oxidase-like deaminating enzyme
VFECKPSDIAVYEADAGILLPERCLSAFREIARRCGADLQFDKKVVGWQANGPGVVVETSTERFEAGNLIITAGAWLPTIAADLNLPLSIERQVQLWFVPREPAAFERERMPIFIHFEPDRSYYGIPIVPADPPFDRAVKIARHHGGAITTADRVNRTVTIDDEADVRSFIQRHLPQADSPLVASRVCLYTNSPDDHFIVDRHPRHANVFIAGGFSGHGFKFAPLIAEIVADWLTTDPGMPAADLFSIARFDLRR